MYIDSHAHIEGKVFDADREAMLARARAAGLKWLLAIGNGEAAGSYGRALEYAGKYEWIYASTGLHPQDARLASPEVYDEMARLAQNKRLLAWGEIGLDYFYEKSGREVQRRVFVEQMELARAAGKPIIIHCRPSDKSTDAWDEALELIEEHWRPTGLGGILHCFTGGLTHARRALDLGFLLSFAGNISYPSAGNIREAAGYVPRESFLIETDCPYLAPIPHRGQRNEPAYVVETARVAGAQRGCTGEEAGRQAVENFERFFGLA
jgi:TatD DNase family protein